jgi:hypothetical protein
MREMTEREKNLEQLTRKAFRAASDGKWSEVIQFYDQRGRTGWLDDVSPDVAKQLMKYDRWMMTRVQEVQALTQQHLGEAQDHRRRLESLKRQWVGPNTGQARHRLSI